MALPAYDSRSRAAGDGAVASSDLLVVGWDMCTDKEVFIEDASVQTWRRKSYRRGDGSLICAHCLAGHEAPVGTVVPLVVKHREGGFRRAHFAHPPGMAPVGGHAPETLWHSEAKHRLARWAATQPNVISAVAERMTADGTRRADVLIALDEGSRLALEVQHRLLHDADWSERHDDYRANGVVDVWLWHPSLTRQLPMISATTGCPIWFLDLAGRRIGTVWGQPHRRPHNWFADDDLSVYVPHQPPCHHDTIDYAAMPWTEFGLDRDGLRQPPQWALARQNTLAGVRDEAAAARHERDRRSAERAAQQRAAATRVAAEATRPAARTLPGSRPDSRGPPQTAPSEQTPPPSPPWQIPKGVKPPICDLCPYPLAPMWWDTGRHGDCEEQRILREQATLSKRARRRSTSTSEDQRIPQSERLPAADSENGYLQPELPLDW